MDGFSVPGTSFFATTPPLGSHYCAPPLPKRDGGYFGVANWIKEILNQHTIFMESPVKYPFYYTNLRIIQRM